MAPLPKTSGDSTSSTQNSRETYGVIKDVHGQYWGRYKRQSPLHGCCSTPVEVVFFCGFGQQKRHNPTNPLGDVAQRLVSKWHTLGRTPTSQGSIKQLSQRGIFTQDDRLLQWQIVLGPKKIIIQERPARGLKAWNGKKSRAEATVHSSVMISFHTSTSNSFICPASGWAMKKRQSGMWQTFRIHRKPGIWPTLSTTDGLRKLNFPKALCECYLDKHGEPAAIH